MRGASKLPVCWVPSSAVSLTPLMKRFNQSEVHLVLTLIVARQVSSDRHWAQHDRPALAMASSVNIRIVPGRPIWNDLAARRDPD